MTSRIVTRTAVTAVAALAVIAPLAGCSATDTPPPATPQPTSSDSGMSTPSPSPTTNPSRPEYRDGTFTARGVYGGAPSYMDFTITIEDGIITDVESGLMADNNDTSRGYQERFAAALPDEVIGKSIDEVEVGILAGSSSCGDGFNDAVAQIREQAATNQ